MSTTANAAADDLDRHVREALGWLEKHFLHPKLGLPYDYFSPAGECPRRAFAGGRDAKQNLPNAHGFGAGFALTAQNLALLLDGVLLRLELGIAAPPESALADRLVDGLLRLSTAAPRQTLVRGLAHDGRAYFAGIDAGTATAYAFAAWRALTSPCLAPEQQATLRAATLAWLERVEREGFRLTFPDGRPLADGDLAAPADGLRGPWLLGLASLLGWLAPTPERTERLSAWRAEAGGARLAPGGAPTPAPDGEAPTEAREEDDPWTAVWRQYARRLAEGVETDADAKQEWRRTTQGVGARLLSGVEGWRDFAPDGFPGEVDYEWRKAARPQEGPGPRDSGAPGCGGWSERRTGFVAPVSWARLVHEHETLGAGLARSVCGLLGGDAETCSSLPEAMGELLRTAEWSRTQTCRVGALAVAVHARGVELGLWDAELPEKLRVTPAKNESFAARFLTADYDERHPEQAGHGDPKVQEEEPGPQRGRRRRRRRRR